MTLNIGIDCCTQWTSIGVSENGGILSEIHLNIGRKQSSALAKAVDEALRFADRTLAQTGRIVLTTGPGSFTGVRVGLSYGLALAAALGCPVVPVNTLEFIAHQAVPISPLKILLPVLWAKRGFVYAAAYSFTPASGRFSVVHEPGYFSVSALKETFLPLKEKLLLILEKNRSYDDMSDFDSIPGRLAPSGGLLSTLGDLYSERFHSFREVKGTYLRPPDVG